jgi:hypothetical protein
MQRETSRIHRLAIPLIIKRNGTSLHVSDGIFGHDFEFRDFGQIKIVGIDPDGFVTFEIMIPEQKTIIESSQSSRFATSASFTLIGSSSSKTSGSGTKRGTYEYFKRSTDEYYYAVHRMGGQEDKKIHLGSLQEPGSAIYRILRACQRFVGETWFDRKQLSQTLTKALTHGQKMKSALDILVIEGYLERRESQKKGKAYEQYKTALKIQTIK